MRNSIQGSDKALLKVSRFKELGKKLSSMFTSGMGLRVIWTTHAAERLVERFNGKPTQAIASLLSTAISLLQDENTSDAIVRVQSRGVAAVVAVEDDNYKVVTVMTTSSYTTSYSFD